jgi:membrane-bound lytic murein transglycosylase D
MKRLAISLKLQAASLFLITISAVGAFAQTVPSEMMLGDLRLSINESTRKQIQKDVDRLTQSQTYFNILVDRMNLYFPIIEREHGNANVPDEIKFLAIQESALISDAVSSANAVGYWQFKDFTAREVGLTVDRNVDERLNIVSSSRGSAKYMNSHNYFLKNWVYSVMAYNTGRGGAQKYVDNSNLGAKRMTINNQTHWYVKKFIAHIVAFTPYVGHPHSEGIWLDEVTNAGGKSLNQIAREEKVDVDELEKYNKWLKRGDVPKDKTYSVLIPRQGNPPKRAVAQNNKRSKISEPEKKIYPTELKPGISEANKSTIIPLNGIPSILARNGDDVHSVSARAGISEKRFRKYNDMDESDKIIPNEFYYIKKKKGKAKIGLHVAKRNESLWEISQQYGIRLSKLAKRNRMSIIDELKPGRVLWMDRTRPSSEPIAYHELSKPVITKPVAKATASTNNVDDAVITKESIDEPIDEELIEEEEVPDIIVPVVDTKEERLNKVKIHTIAAGETLWSISRLYEVEMEDLLRWNHLPEPNAISIGQNIQVKAPIEEASEGKNIINHTVQPGETVYAISRKYGMTVDEVVDLNNLNGFDLNVGQELKVYASK